MRITVVSRIFLPEPAAASFRLAALVRALENAGHDVTVMTTKAPANLATGNDDQVPGRVRRAPVLRDKTGYVRGYLQYLSFDVPAFFRVLLSRRPDAVIVEPPPTTGVVVRLACALRRIPYVYYAADVWSDASASTGAPGFDPVWDPVSGRFDLGICAFGDLAERHHDVVCGIHRGLVEAVLAASGGDFRIVRMGRAGTRWSCVVALRETTPVVTDEDLPASSSSLQS